MEKRARGKSVDSDRLLEDVADLKRLMIIQLLASGVQSNHIAKALGVHKSTISGMVPVRDIQQHLGK